MSRLKILSKNIKYNVISQIFNSAMFFVLMPFIVSHVGKEVYGVYILATTFTGYLGLLDFGISTAIIKYVAEFSGKSDHDNVNSIVSASFSFYVAVGCATALTLFVLSIFFESLFKVAPANKLIVKQIFLIVSISSLFIWPGRTFEGVLLGSQRYGILAITGNVMTLLSAIATYLILSSGLSIIYYLMASYFFNVLKFGIYYIWSQRHILRRKIIFPYFNQAVFRLIFKFSFYVFLSSIVNVVIFNLDNFIVGAFVSVQAVTLYSVSASLQNIFRFISSLIGGPLFPANAEMEGKGEIEKQKVLLLKGTRLMTLIFIPMVISTIIFSRPLIINWMGEDFTGSIVPAIVLLMFWVFNGALEIGAGMLTAKGHVKDIFNIGIINAIFNLVLSLILVKYLGTVGVALGTSIPMIFINFPLMVNLILRVSGIGFWEYCRVVVNRNFPIYIIIALVSFLLCKFSTPKNLPIVILQMGLSYLAAMAAAYLFVFSCDERREIREIVGL